MTGIIFSFDERKAYGFISPLIGDPNAPKVFFHVSGICQRMDGFKPAIPIGAEVSFDLVRGKSGPQAANIRLRMLKGSVLQRTSHGRVFDSTSEFGPAAQVTRSQTSRHGPVATDHPPISAEFSAQTQQVTGVMNADSCLSSRAEKL